MHRTIAVDFDGTLCTSKYPEIGEPNMTLIEQLKEARKNGCYVILWTCREGRLLKDAVKWCKGFGLEFDYLNRNPPERIRKFKSDCRKIGADVYIDDRNAKFVFGEKIGGI